jgi:hypothetical protein
MAIQLNERDQLIFKLIDEHHVLLEKHISWFIAESDKPVLIRDRLRKLFYLDYLQCHRHGSKLPWWTTPTKPLVYMLTGISRQSDENEELDLFDSAVQRHFLEVANIRMLCLMAKKDGDLKDFEWLTYRAPNGQYSNLDALISIKTESNEQVLGLINHPEADHQFLLRLKNCLSQTPARGILVVSRDEAHQKQLQELLCTHGDNAWFQRVLFVTHHELYRNGITKACLEKSEKQQVNLFGLPLAASVALAPWVATFSSTSALSA